MHFSKKKSWFLFGVFKINNYLCNIEKKEIAITPQPSTTR